MPQRPSDLLAREAPKTPEDKKDERRPAAALCLSGGGYRAMLFHVGALRRLNETGYLEAIDRFSSVSGGSITAAALAMHWTRLRFVDGVAQNYDLVEQQVFDFAKRRVDGGAIAGGVFRPRHSISDSVARAYRKHLFNDRTLQDMPDSPRFVFNATNLQTGALLRCQKPYVADYRIGMWRNPDLSLASVVAASSAFPPVLSPRVIRVAPGSFTATGAEKEVLHREPYTTRLVLADGGVYDNLGLQPAERHHTIFISDGGAGFKFEESVGANWASQAKRSWLTTDNQVRSLRKLDMVDEYKRRERLGAYWGITTKIGNYQLADALHCPTSDTRKLAEVKTRLWRLKTKTRYRLMNWGYAVCDAALRKHIDPTIPVPDGFPHPHKVG